MNTKETPLSEGSRSSTPFWRWFVKGLGYKDSDIEYEERAIEIVEKWWHEYQTGTISHSELMSRQATLSKKDRRLSGLVADHLYRLIEN